MEQSNKRKEFDAADPFAVGYSSETAVELFNGQDVRYYFDFASKRGVKPFSFYKELLSKYKTPKRMLLNTKNL